MWAYNETFYQIYPIGFCGAPVHNDGVCVPRIKKIGEWAGYLEDLGIGSIILNPIFESDAGRLSGFEADRGSGHRVQRGGL